MAKELILHDTATGKYWLPDAEKDWVIETILLGRIWDWDLVNYIERRICPGDTILDIGANFGQMAVLFSKMVGYDGSVHSFEADPFIHSVLEKNVRENNCSNVTAHCMAVWDKDGEEIYYPEPDLEKFDCYGQYGIDPTANTGQRLIGTTIDSLNLQKVDLMKIDVQGSDLRAMKGAVDTINRCKPIVIFEFEPMLTEKFGVTEHDYVQFMYSINYRQTHNIDFNIIMEPVQYHSG
jgi:FkbM family methyltransferase